MKLDEVLVNPSKLIVQHAARGFSMARCLPSRLCWVLNIATFPPVLVDIVQPS